jgi:hypothetical protein
MKEQVEKRTVGKLTAKKRTAKKPSMGKQAAGKRATGNKTVANDGDVLAFIDCVEPLKRREDARTLLDLMIRVTGDTPTMWGENIIGFGTYHYKYASGREGDFFRTGFSPRKTALTIYIMPGYQDYSDILSRLGKHKLGKSCLYINKLADIDMQVLEELINAGLATMNRQYPIE